MRYNEIKEKARKLRKNPTASEKYLWKFIRNKQLEGKKFLRQHPIIYEINKKELFFFIPDFYCSEVKLSVELDGDIHKFTVEHDKNRDDILKSNGIRVLRIKNEELKDIDAVLKKIKQALIPE
ncbi:MAG TPA: DUF559 domain-containing protein [Bacteroidales bacterium]|nr:DUF559 domain-containing protein [Bacteroidales bacterium]